jgi:hypothetical protein
MSMMATLAQFPESIDVVKGDSVSINGIDIYTDLLRAHIEYQHERWTNSGKYVGEASRKIITGKQSFAQMEALYNAEASLI